MDKNAIKKYAVWARRELISRVSQKALQYGITDNNIVPATATSVNGVVLSAEEQKQRKALIEQINSKGYEQVMEEVAYTWFNRFIALRFMEVNGYLPSRVRVFTDENNAFNPQILTEAISLEMDGLDMEKVYTLKDANDDDGLFKYLVIVQCNALSPILPRMFQRISDYTELLFPDNLLREGSAIEQMIAMIPEEDWKDAVQIIGWLYQYYNSEKKDEVFAALQKNVKITKENIPAATQLFTPDWIVRYMVENSLGRLWIEGHPNDELRSAWRYYLDEGAQEPTVQTQLAAIRREYASITPEQIKCIDPCAGSGHILAYMFDVLVQIYEAYGYTAREAVRSIIENNIYGLDIDDRAAQLAYFAVMMKARQYDRRFLTRKAEDGHPDVPQANVFVIVESNDVDAYALEYFLDGNPELKVAMRSIITDMKDAKEFGSILNITPVDFDALYARFDAVQEDISISREMVLNGIMPLVQVAEVLANKYDVVVTNPPYMGGRNMNTKLLDRICTDYPEGKADIFAAFISKTVDMTLPKRFTAMITQHSWMFLSSFESLRRKMLSIDFPNMCHLGPRAFEEISGEVVQTTTWVSRKGHIKDYKGSFVRLVGYDSQSNKENAYLSGEAPIYSVPTKQFIDIPGSAFAYWLANPKVFMQGTLLEEVANPRQGLKTLDNDYYIHFWYEVGLQTLCFDAVSSKAAQESAKKWFPINHGGEYRKYYGNNYSVVNWYDDGAEMKANAIRKYNSITRTITNMAYYFREGITWSVLCSQPSFRWYGNGYIFSNGGQCVVPDRPLNLKYLVGLLNSKITGYLLNILSPTLGFESGYLKKIPIIESSEHRELVERLADENIAHSKTDWDAFEVSWDFAVHPFVRLSRDLWDATAVGASMHYYYGSHPKVSCPLELCYMLWQGECKERFTQIRENETELNRIFIDVYGLQGELTPDVEDKDITVRLADKKRDIKGFISYAVGCMFGRYSLDVPGLAYAGGEWDDSKYVTFKADKDSIIPICDDEYFSDDIVGRFIRFIEVVYGRDTLNENLRFIADALGGSGQPKDVIRKYFMDEFYSDHLKMYQKRPIYWLFDSGKKGGFRALIYMHRYQPDTIARMRTDYVHEQQARYRTAIADLEQRIASASTSERVKLSKRLKTLQEQATEIQGYEEKIHHLADQYIAIDLDDGVKKNYEIFKDVLAKIK